MKMKAANCAICIVGDKQVGQGSKPRKRGGWRINKFLMKSIQQKTVQTIVGLASMKYPSLSLISRFVSLAALAVSAGLVFVQPCSAGSGAFQQTGSLANGRAFYTATLLPNGKVLAAGGSTTGSSGSLASAELYDPASGTWTATASLGTKRIHHTATLLPNGKVLVAGGYNETSGALASCELYDPASGTWKATGSMNTVRYDCPATLLSNGKVLVAAGETAGDVPSAELYDPATGTWTLTGSLPGFRVNHTATLLSSGKVLVAGGFNGTDMMTAVLYDPASGIWTATGNLTTQRNGHTATLLPSGKVLVAAGDGAQTAELYDPASATWTATGSPAYFRVLHTATLLPNGKVLIAGNNYITNRESAELYDPASGTWSATGSLHVGRANHTATLLGNGEVLVAGGTSDTSVNLASAELYGGQPPPGTLLNISTRMRVLTGEQVLIAGFIITGTDPKNVIIRGIGPSLTGVGITLADPTLELHQGSTTLATNDNWKINHQTGQSQQAEIEATTVPPKSDLESAILMTLSPGSYTAILAGKNGGTGVGVVEVYDLARAANSQLANISTRGFVDTDSNVMIGGFIVGGGAANVIVLALGPSIPVNGALADPTLELHDASGATLATNDNWKINDQTGQSQQAEIEATTSPPTNDLESAVVQTFAPGNYTAIVRGRNNTTGVGLVAAYNLR
jgi:WD40 repeat protein